MEYKSFKEIIDSIIRAISELQDKITRIEHKKFGLYKAIVVDNEDPQNLGRIKVRIPRVMGKSSIWAFPSIPFGGNNCGFFMLPPKGSFVRILFENGNSNYPVWIGGWWAKKSDNVPQEFSKGTYGIITPDGHQLLVKENDICIKHKNGESLSIVIGNDTINISSNGKAAARKGDKCSCSVAGDPPHSHTVIIDEGSDIVKIG